MIFFVIPEAKKLYDVHFQSLFSFSFFFFQQIHTTSFASFLLRHYLSNQILEFYGPKNDSWNNFPLELSLCEVVWTSRLSLSFLVYVLFPICSALFYCSTLCQKLFSLKTRKKKKKRIYDDRSSSVGREPMVMYQLRGAGFFQEWWRRNKPWWKE